MVTGLWCVGADSELQPIAQEMERLLGDVPALSHKSGPLASWCSPVALDWHVHEALAMLVQLGSWHQHVQGPGGH